MDHCSKPTFLLILLLLFTSPSSGETVLPSDQVREIAATAADLDIMVDHVNQQARKVSDQMQARKLVFAVDAMLDYEKPKPNPRHDDKGRSGGG